MKTTLTLLTALLLAPLGALHAADAQAIKLTPEHIAAVNQQRRIFCQYDPTDFEASWLGKDIDVLMRYRFGYIDQPGSQVDAICFDWSNESAVPYESRILPFIQHPGLLRWKAQGVDTVARMVAEAHKRGKEIWWNHRVNEVERGDGAPVTTGGGTELEKLNPVKAQHPDWVIKSWWWQGNWNLAVPGVRAYKLGILKELAGRYDFDGIQLDFMRHTPHLPPGRQWELRDGITQFIADVRVMLLQRGRERGRPFLLAVRVDETLEGCRIDGYDVQEWAARDLVDIIALGTRTMNVDVAGFRKVVGTKNIKLMPSFDGTHATDAYWIQPIELLRGVYGNWWAQGADTVGTFNWDAASPSLSRELGGQVGMWKDRPLLTDEQLLPRTIAVGEIGSAATLRGKPCFYAIERRGGYECGEGYYSLNEHALLPVRLRNDGTAAALNLPVWVKLPAGATAILRLVCFNLLPTDRLAVTLNGKQLSAAVTDDQWKDPLIFSPNPQLNAWPAHVLKDTSKQQLTRIEFPVSVTDLKQGSNALSVRASQRGAFKPVSQIIQVEKVELHVK
jgi:hypothetical protein